MKAIAAACALALAAGPLAACQSVGPVHIGQIDGQKALKLAHDELMRRHMEAYAGWRTQVADYDKVWVVTYYRPADRSEGPSLVRVSFNKHTEQVVAVDTVE